MPLTDKLQGLIGEWLARSALSHANARVSRAYMHCAEQLAYTLATHEGQEHEGEGSARVDGHAAQGSGAEAGEPEHQVPFFA